MNKYLVWEPTSGHKYGAYPADNGDKAIDDCAAEFGAAYDALEALDIEDLLAQSIASLASEDYGDHQDTSSGWAHHVILDPAACHVYAWSTIGTGGWPEAVHFGRHPIVVSFQAGAIAASVVETVRGVLGALIDYCVAWHNDADDVAQGADAWDSRDTDGQIDYWWHPGDWYDDRDEIKRLICAGHSVPQIVDEIGLGDGQRQLIKREAAEAWMADTCDEIRAEALEAISDADDHEYAAEAAAEACALHLVPFAPTESFGMNAERARQAGFNELADALVDLGDRVEQVKARACYGCGCDLDPHAGLSVVYCGRCGDGA